MRLRSARRCAGEAPIGPLLKEVLHTGPSHNAMAEFELMIDRLSIEPADKAFAHPDCGCKGRSGDGDAVDSSGGATDFATMSLLYTDSSGDDSEPNDDVDGDGKPDDPITVTGDKPKDVDEDDDSGWIPDPGGGGGGDDSEGDGPGGGEVIAEETPCVDQKPAGTDLGKLNDLAKTSAIKLGALQDDTGWEWGALIYRGAEGGLHVTAPFTSQEHDRIDVAISLPAGSHVVGYVHTHPVSNNTDERRPSPDDRDFLNVMSSDSSGTVTGDPNMLLYVVTKDEPLGSSPSYKTYVYDKSEWNGEDVGCPL